MPATLEEKVNQCLETANLTLPQLATQMSLSEPELTTICRLSELRLSELQCLYEPHTYFLNGSFLQADNRNIQKINIGKVAAHELAEQLGLCSKVLEQSQQLMAAKDALLELKDALLALQEEGISLLCGEYNRPN